MGRAPSAPPPLRPFFPKASRKSPADTILWPAGYGARPRDHQPGAPTRGAPAGDAPTGREQHEDGLRDLPQPAGDVLRRGAAARRPALSLGQARPGLPPASLVGSGRAG